LLLRDSLPTKARLVRKPSVRIEFDPAEERAPDNETGVDEHICITDHNATVREVVGGKTFEFTAGNDQRLIPSVSVIGRLPASTGTFFQNNPSIRPSLIDYICSQFPTDLHSSNFNLIDAYCGSGFFSISLAHMFANVVGIEISDDSITFARHNAKLNGLDNVTYITGNAEEIFKVGYHPPIQWIPRIYIVDLIYKEITFEPSLSYLIIDPPRKGCDSSFLDQVIAFSPKKIIYISCNVHTQARDVGYLVRGVGGKAIYRIESIRGADFFPQTYHIEGVCILSKTDDTEN
jgi:tRNA (uracil-5-)-methyltransferase